jgi:hypothetical protein
MDFGRISRRQNAKLAKKTEPEETATNSLNLLSRASARNTGRRPPSPKKKNYFHIYETRNYVGPNPETDLETLFEIVSHFVCGRPFTSLGKRADEQLSVHCLSADCSRTKRLESP